MRRKFSSSQFLHEYFLEISRGAVAPSRSLNLLKTPALIFHFFFSSQNYVIIIIVTIICHHSRVRFKKVRTENGVSGGKGGRGIQLNAGI